MKKLNIGLFLEHYDPFISGVITSVKGLADAFEQHGHNVYIVCPSAKDYEDNHPNIIRTPSISTKHLENTTIGLPSPFIKNKLMKINFDVIHSHEVFYTANMGLQLARRQNVPYIQTYHTLWDKFINQYGLNFRIKSGGVMATIASYPFYFGLKPTYELFRKTIAKPSSPSPNKLSQLMWHHMVNMGNNADYVVVPSKHLEQSLIESGLKTPIKYIPNGITPFSQSQEMVLPAKAKGSLRMLTVARLSPEKRINVLIEALKLLKKPLAELIIVGEGPSETELEKLALSLGVIKKIRFMGTLSNQAVRQIMRESDFFCLPSYDFDNRPMVFAEAVEAGLPIIYCDPKLADGLSTRNSRLVGWQAKDFAQAIDKLTMADLRQMSKASRGLASKFEIGRVADATLDVYKSALATAR